MATASNVKGVSYRDGGKGRTKAQKRLLLFRTQRGICAICSRPMTLAASTLDHIRPRSLGGANRQSNLRLAHERCNQERGNSVSDLFVEEAGVVALRWNVKELP